MSAQVDCQKTDEGQLAVQVAKTAARDLAQVIVGPLTPERIDPLFAVIHQLVLEDALRHERDPHKKKHFEEEWWKAQGHLSKRSVSRFLDERVGND